MKTSQYVQHSWHALCLSPGVRGRVGIWILLNSRSKHANSTSIAKLVIWCMPSQQLEPVRQHIPNCLETDGWQRGCGKLPCSNDLSTSKNIGNFHVWEGAAAFAEPVLLSGKCCLQFFSCSELSQATSTTCAAFLVHVYFLVWEISLDG